MRLLIIIALLLSATYLHGQNSGTIGYPSEGPDSIFVIGNSADSLGIIIPIDQIVIGTGTKAPRSTDSLTWDAGLFVNGPVTFSNLPDLAPSAGDSLLMISNSGVIGKTVMGTNFFTSDGTATGNRIHDFNAFGLTIENISALAYEANTSWSVRLPTSGDQAQIVGFNGIGVATTTTGANSIFLTSGNDIDLSATDNLVFDSPDIFFEDALTINNTADSILVRNNATGEIQSRSASTLGTDGLGSSPTSGAILFGQGSSTAGTDATNLFWDDANNRLGVGISSPIGDLHVSGLAPTTQSSLIVQSDNANTVMTSTFAAISLRNNDATSNNYIRINFQDASSTAASAIAGRITDHTSDYGTLEFWTRSSAGFSQKMVITENGRIGIGGTPAVSAILDVSSTTGALLLPRMTTAQRNALTAVNGMLVYDTDMNKILGYEGGAWTDI